MDTLRLGLAQVDPESAPTMDGIAARLDTLVDRGADLLLLPEFWNAAFDGDRLARGALSADERELRTLLAWSRRHPSVVLCPGSLPVRLHDTATGPGLANRSWLLQDDAVIARYDKLHLFGPMGEPGWVRAGEEAVVATVRPGGHALRVGLSICYDLRFPELFRDLAARGAELILLPAQWPAKRIFAFHHLLRARAIENGVAVVGCNRSGTSGRTVFAGGSAAYGMGDGQVFLAPLENGQDAVFEIDLAAVAAERAKLDAVADRRYALRIEATA